MMCIANSMKVGIAGALAMGVILSASAVHAVDGVIEINAASAAAGSITAGDAPGFPVTISEQGSYRLTSDLEVPNLNTIGIEITTSYVTVDLNGFTLFGPGGGSGTGDGIRATATRSDIVVKNGTVRAMGSGGIRLAGGQGRVENVHASRNNDDGIQLGSHGMVRNCTASANGDIGIIVSTGGSLIENKSRQNGFASGFGGGLGLGEGGIAIGNTSRDNTGEGLVTNRAATIVNNSFYNNSEDGVRTLQGSLLRGNTARDNGFFGFNLGTGSGYGGNVLTNNTSGSVTGGIQIDGNVCGTNTVCP